MTPLKKDIIEQVLACMTFTEIDLISLSSNGSSILIHSLE